MLFLCGGLILSRGRCKYNSLQYGRIVISARAVLILARGRRRYNSLQYGRTEKGKRRLNFALGAGARTTRRYMDMVVGDMR